VRRFRPKAADVAIPTGIIIGLAGACVLATPPHATVVVRPERGPYVVEFHPLDAPVIVRNTESNTLAGIEFKQFGLDKFTPEQLQASTAGSWWYKNALAFFAPDGKTLVIRLGNGKMLGVDLAKGRPMPDIPKDLADLGRRRSVEVSAKLLTSSNPLDRETGAIVGGQETIREAIPRLKELLKDEAYYVSGCDIQNMTRVYYVRKAADRALRSMGEAVGNGTLEEPHRWIAPDGPSILPPVIPEEPAPGQKGNR